MKKNRIGLIGLLVSGILTAGTIVAKADTQTITGETEASVMVNGIVGEFDPEIDGPEPVDPNSWIKVTLPTTALFYSASTDLANLVSPTYNVTNRSARAVEVKVASVTNAQDLTPIDSLSMNGINLITSGSVDLSGQPTLFTLSKNSETPANSNTFSFSGTASSAPTLTNEVNPSFDLVLQFSAIIDQP